MKESIEMYVVEGHEACELACQFLESKGIPFKKIVVGVDMNLAVEMWARSGCHTLPQIFIGYDHVGGLPDLLDMAESGELERRVKAD